MCISCVQWQNWLEYKSRQGSHLRGITLTPLTMQSADPMLNKLLGILPETAEPCIKVNQHPLFIHGLTYLTKTFNFLHWPWSICGTDCYQQIDRDNLTIYSTIFSTSFPKVKITLNGPKIGTVPAVGYIRVESLTDTVTSTNGSPGQEQLMKLWKPVNQACIVQHTSQLAQCS